MVDTRAGASSLGGSGVCGLALEPVQQLLLYEAVDGSPALVFVADDDMRYIAVNSTACEVLGYTREELLAMLVTDIVTDAQAADLYQGMIRETQQQGDVALRAKDGSLLPFVYQASEIRINRIQYWVSVGFVNSALLEKSEQLETALRSRIVIEQAKGVIAGKLGLDLQTAFQVLRRGARSNHIRLRTLCERVVSEREIPQEILAGLSQQSSRRRLRSAPTKPASR